MTINPYLPGLTQFALSVPTTDSPAPIRNSGLNLTYPFIDPATGAYFDMPVFPVPTSPVSYDPAAIPANGQLQPDMTPGVINVGAFPIVLFGPSPLLNGAQGDPNNISALPGQQLNIQT